VHRTDGGPKTYDKHTGWKQNKRVIHEFLLGTLLARTLLARTLLPRTTLLSVFNVLLKRQKAKREDGGRSSGCEVAAPVTARLARLARLARGTTERHFILHNIFFSHDEEKNRKN
jgi:hypothetical protein